MKFPALLVTLWLLLCLVPNPQTLAKARNDERRTTYYPGNCPNNATWYFISSDSDSVTVGCQDPDYSDGN